tara:strand:+ start:202 stop:864 length:663 start_codon:yes stop_codon:yes gene_type:complete
MGLLNKKSLYDIVPGPNAPVGDAGTFLPEKFDKGKTSTIQQDSLLKKYFYTYGDSQEIAGPVPGGDSNSPFQDLNGLQGPQFQKPIELASKAHEESLLAPTDRELDLNGEKGPIFDKGKTSTIQQDSLLEQYTYRYGETDGLAGPSRLDLDGELPTPFQPQGGLSLEGEDLHVGLLTNSYTKNNVTIGPSPGPSGYSQFQDLDGAKPPTYENNGPSDGYY